MIKKMFLMIGLVLSLNMAPGAFAQSAIPSPATTLDSGNFMFDLTPITHEAIRTETRQGWIRRGVNYFFERIISFMAAVIGGLSVLILSIGGFLMLSSAGDETRYEKGKNYAKFAIIGLIVTLSAYILVTLVQLLIRSIYGS